MENATVKCPKCNEAATPSNTRFGVRHDHCGLWSWDGAPLADKETHDARTAAHAAFDVLWKVLGMERRRAYQWLAAEMNMRPRDCHIKLMDAETAKRVPGAVDSIRRAWR